MQTVFGAFDELPQPVAGLIKRVSRRGLDYPVRLPHSLQSSRSGVKNGVTLDCRGFDKIVLCVTERRKFGTSVTMAAKVRLVAIRARRVQRSVDDRPFFAHCHTSDFVILLGAARLIHNFED